MKFSLKSRLLRRVLSLSPLLGLKPRPARPQGISALVRIWNEREWLEPVVEALAPHVDEIVAVDTGSDDGSYELLARLAGREPKLKLFSCQVKRPWDFNNFAVERASFRWLLKWDADLLAVPGNGGMDAFCAWLRGLDPRRYYYLNPKFIELTGDFAHQFPDMRVRSDVEAFTYSPDARYVDVTRTLAASPYPVKLPAKFLPPQFRVSMEGLKIPRYYGLSEFGGVVGYHLNIKPAIRHLYGYFFSQWLGCGASEKMSIEAYTLEQVRSLWGFADLRSAADFYMSEYVKLLSPYDAALGELPETVKRLAAGSGYEVFYEAGRPAGRKENGQGAWA